MRLHRVGDVTTTSPHLDDTDPGVLDGESDAVLLVNGAPSSAGGCAVDETGWPLHWDMDTDAPSYFPEEMAWTTLVIDPATSPLVATQRLLHEHPAFTDFNLTVATRDDDRPMIVAMNQTAYINDGHHRLAAAAAAGICIEVDVWEETNSDDWD